MLLNLKSLLLNLAAGFFAFKALLRGLPAAFYFGNQ
jgi:hypothetical protein